MDMKKRIPSRVLVLFVVLALAPQSKDVRIKAPGFEIEISTPGTAKNPPTIPLRYSRAA